MLTPRIELSAVKITLSKIPLIREIYSFTVSNSIYLEKLYSVNLCSHLVRYTSKFTMNLGNPSINSVILTTILGMTTIANAAIIPVKTIYTMKMLKFLLLLALVSMKLTSG